MQTYTSISSRSIANIPSAQAEDILASCIADKATISGGGKILRWSEFNENPDPLINELLSNILVAKADLDHGITSWNQVVIMSIENSASYLASALAYELAEKLRLGRPVRIIRARKVGSGSTASPAMGEHQVSASVTPITSGGQSRQIVCSVTDDTDFADTKLVFVVDDFKATGSTLQGGVDLAKQLFPAATIVPMAALGKPDQETISLKDDEQVTPVLTALDVSFHPDHEHQVVALEVNGINSRTISHADIAQFTES